MNIRRDEGLNSEIPMGPLIDVVFLLLIFFLVTAKPIQPESDVGMKLPGTVAQEEALDIPNEQRVVIEADGQIVLNDQRLDTPSSQDLPDLVAVLTRFKEMSDASRAEALVTVAAASAARHQRIVDVLNACAIAGLTGVTFATEDESLGETPF